MTHDQKHHKKFVGGILVLHKNALAYNPKLAQAIGEQCDFEELSHHDYTPNI